MARWPDCHDMVECGPMFNSFGTVAPFEPGRRA
jgi:hypothetical protein